MAAKRPGKRVSMAEDAAHASPKHHSGAFAGSVKWSLVTIQEKVGNLGRFTQGDLAALDAALPGSTKPAYGKQRHVSTGLGPVDARMIATPTTFSVYWALQLRLVLQPGVDLE